MCHFIQLILHIQIRHLTNRRIYLLQNNFSLYFFWCAMVNNIKTNIFPTKLSLLDNFRCHGNHIYLKNLGKKLGNYEMSNIFVDY